MTLKAKLREEVRKELELLKPQFHNPTAWYELLRDVNNMNTVGLYLILPVCKVVRKITVK